MKRAIRLLHLIDLLNDRAYSTEELATCFGVSARTIRRDCQGLAGPPFCLPLLKRVRHEWGLLTKVMPGTTESGR